MGRVRLLLSFCLLFMISALPCAFAEQPVLLGFAEAYQAPDGTTATHRGVDIASDLGAQARTPVSGTVRFAGRIPGAHGGTVGAVSIDVEGGILTLLPVDRLMVTAGDHVSANEVVGTISDGDRSNPLPHLHVSYRRGGVYVDPMSLLSPLRSAVQVPAAAPAASLALAPVPSSSPRAPEPAAPIGTGVELAPAVSEVSAANAQAGASAGAPAQASGGLPAGVWLAPRADVPAATAVGVSEAPVIGRSVSAPLNRTVSARAWDLPADPCVVAVLLSVVFGVALLLTRRAITSRVVRPPMSDRFGTLLQHLKAGGIVCGFTSCSGPLPSQSRGH